MTTIQVLEAIEAIKPLLGHEGTRAVVCGGAALTFLNPLYKASDVDVFVYGPGAVDTAKALVALFVETSESDGIVVCCRLSVVTVFRRGFLPVQIVLTTAKSAVDVVKTFDFAVSRASLVIGADGTVTAVGFKKEDGTQTTDEAYLTATYGPDAIVHAAYRQDWVRTRRRLVKYSLQGYALNPGVPPPTPLEVKQLKDAEARAPTWWPDMPWPTMVQHAIYLGGFDGAWCPEDSSGVTLETTLSRLSACEFDNSECEYTHQHVLVSPATLAPPHVLAKTLSRTMTALVQAREALNSLLPKHD